MDTSTSISWRKNQTISVVIHDKIIDVKYEGLTSLTTSSQTQTRALTTDSLATPSLMTQEEVLSKSRSATIRSALAPVDCIGRKVTEERFHLLQRSLMSCFIARVLYYTCMAELYITTSDSI